MGKIYERLKQENETFFAINMFLTLLIAVGFFMVPECHGCYYTDLHSGLEVEGNCEAIYDLYAPKYLTPNDLELIPKTSLKVVVDNLSSDTLVSSTTTTTITQECPRCPPCIQRECKCTCPICTKCPTCSFELSRQQIDWFLNDCQIRTTGACHQVGSADTCDRVREYLEVPGRPKYSTRPRDTETPFKMLYGRGYDDGKVCFEDEGPEYKPDMKFHLNGSVWVVSPLDNDHINCSSNKMLSVHRR